MQGQGSTRLVQEVRSILFTAEECLAAVADALVVRVRGLRTEEVVRVSLGRPAGTARATLRRGGVETVHMLEASEMMSAILLFCRRARIPLSSRSQKRLNLVGERLALTTSINLPSMPPRIVDGAIVHTPAGPDLTMLHRA